MQFRLWFRSGRAQPRPGSLGRGMVRPFAFEAANEYSEQCRAGRIHQYRLQTRRNFPKRAMNIPTYEQWKRDTSLGITKPRSGVLKKLDDGIEKYNKAKSQDNLWAIKNALEDWKRSKG